MRVIKFAEPSLGSRQKRWVDWRCARCQYNYKL